MPQTDSFAEVYRSYLPAATRLARSLTRDDHAAQDIAAEGLVRVWRRWDSGAVAQPWGYIRRTVVNETINQARKRARERDATTRYHPPVQARFEDALDNQDLTQRLLDELPTRQRQIVELRFLDDLSERETALRLGISVGAVKSGASRGLARLRATVSTDTDSAAA